MLSFSIKTLGCKVNQYESELISENLAFLGLKKEAFPCGDFSIINACSVTKKTESKVRNYIYKALKTSKKKIILCGCLSPELKSFAIEKNIAVIANLNKINDTVFYITGKNAPLKFLTSFSAKTRAFVKIQEGCNSFCSYCIIPYLRSVLQSKPFEHILQEILNLESRGYKEIVLTGTHIGKYKYKNFALHNLLNYLIKNTSDKIRFRLSSIEPNEITAPLIEILKNKKVCPHMHIPLQSASTKILKLMNRKYTYTDFRSLISKLRNSIENLTITTDIIVGFPGETEEDFKETLQAIKENQFIKVHIFPFSKRPFTKAKDMKYQIPSKTINERKKYLEDVSSRFTFLAKKEWIGKTVTVLFERKNKSMQEFYEGFSENYLKVLVKSHNCLHNQFKEVLLKKINSNGSFEGIIKQG